MRKITSIVHNKIWGNEVWLYSPVKNNETKFEDNNQLNNFGPLIKIISANQPLSIQVHPDDLLAKRLENEPNGKNEAWIVLESSKGSKLVYGSKTIDKETIRKSVLDNTLDKHLNFVDATVGNFYNVPAGLIHGIGYNLKDYVKVLEVQQPSDVTYRLYDYHRKQTDGTYRELHLEKSLESLKFTEIDSKSTQINANYTIFKLDNYLIHQVNNIEFKNDDYSWYIEKDNYSTYLVEPNEVIENAVGWIVTISK